jgi:hypothetical protein
MAMKERSHTKMRRQIQWSADGRLTPSQQQALDAHLATCVECRLYAQELRALETQLASVSVTRLAPPKPRATAQQVAAIQASYRRHIMKKSILSVAGALAAFAVVAVFITLISRLVPGRTSPGAAPTETGFINATDGFEPIQPAWLPEGYAYTDSKSLNNGQTTCLYYRGRGDDAQFPSLVIIQSRADLPTVEQLRDPLYAEINIAPEDIPISRETVQLGGASGEANLIETGMDASQLCGGTRLPMGKVLMWQAGDQNFVLFTQSNAWWDVAFLTKLEMRRVAESMTGVTTIAEDTMDPERLPSIESAAAMSGFPISEPAKLPDGFQFDYAAYWQDGESRNVLLVYRVNDVLLGFNILQTSEPPETMEARMAANPDIYEKVVVNNQPAWFSMGECWDENNKPFTENCGAPQSLIWFENGMEYSIVGFFSKEAIIAIAESMTGVSALAITEAEAQVGYSLKTLASLPTGYIFSRVVVHQPTNSVCVVYEYTRNDGYGPELWLAQGPITNVPGLAAQQGFAETPQTPVSVGGAGEAYSVYGMARVGEWACGRPQDGSDPALRLTWQAAGQQYDLYALYGKCLLEEGLSDLDLLRLAEGMTGVPSHTADKLDLQCTKDIAALELLAGYQVRLPADIIGMEFVGASYSGPPLMQILLYYKELGSNHAGLLIRQMPVNPVLGNDLASQFRELPEDGYQLLTIDGNPAVIILGDWTRGELGGYVWHQESSFTPTFSFESKGLLISFGGPWLADAGDKLLETLIALAESLASEGSRTILKTSVGEFAYISARLVYEIEDVKVKADPGYKILEVVLAYPDGSKITSDTLDLNDFVAAQREAGVYILGDDGSQTTNPMAGFMMDGFVMGFMVPETLTSYQLVWPGNNPISIYPEQTIESTASDEKPPFSVIEPTWLPSGYQLSGSSYYTPTNAACLIYRSPQDGPWSSMVLAQSPDVLPSIEALSAPFYSDPDDESPSPYVEAVPIGGAVGEQGVYYVQNIFDASQVCGGGRRPLAQALYWQSGETHFVILPTHP